MGCGLQAEGYGPNLHFIYRSNLHCCQQEVLVPGREMDLPCLQMIGCLFYCLFLCSLTLQGK